VRALKFFYEQACPVFALLVGTKGATLPLFCTTTMRIILGILLLAALSAPLFGTYAGLCVEKQRVKKEVKKRLMNGVDSTDLVFFQFSKHDSKTLLRWEHAWEFEYQEQLYDVVKKIERGDSVLLWCWWDHAETALNKQLHQLVVQRQSSDPRRHEKERRVVYFFLTLFYLEPPDMRALGSGPERLRPPLADCIGYRGERGSPPYPPPEWRESSSHH